MNYGIIITMITPELLSDAIANINQINSGETENSLAFPNPFIYNMTRIEKDLYERVKEKIINEDYLTSTSLLNITGSPFLIRQMLNSLLLDFCRAGNVSAFNFVISSGAEINFDNNLPFVTICKNGHLSLLLACI